MNLCSTRTRATLVVGSLLLVAAQAACTSDTEAQKAGDEPLMAAEGGGGGDPPPPPPPPPAPSYYTGKQYAGLVRNVAKYVLGAGSSVMPACKDGTSVLSKAPALQTLRTYIQNGQCTVGKPTKAYGFPQGNGPCGITVATTAIDCTISSSEISYIASIHDALNSCWPNPVAAYYNYYCSDTTFKYPQAGDFWAVPGTQIIMTGCAPSPCTAPPPTYHLLLDPEPAVLNGDLGTSASATYTDSGAYTTAYQWPATYAYGPSIPPGSPCSTYAMSAGTEVLGVVQAWGSYYRKCVQ